MKAAETVRGRHRKSLSLALGPSLLRHLENPDVIELQLNPDGRVFLERHSRGLESLDLALKLGHAEALLTTIAGILGEELTRDRPYLEGELPFDGSRITAQIPPIVTAPSFIIRKRPSTIYRLHEYVEGGILDPRAALVLRNRIAPEDREEDARSVVVAGGPGSGKTTLANALIAEVAEAVGRIERLILIEDTPELQCASPCKLWPPTAVVLLALEGRHLGPLVIDRTRALPERVHHVAGGG